MARDTGRELNEMASSSYHPGLFEQLSSQCSVPAIGHTCAGSCGYVRECEKHAKMHERSDLRRGMPSVLSACEEAELSMK